MIAANDELLHLSFPLQGVDVSTEYDQQPAGTTILGANVRSFEAITQRGRGGSRAGISKVLNSQVSGTNSIQCLDLIVTTSGDALGWSFDGLPQGDIGDLGIDSGPAGISGGIDGFTVGQVSGGGGGYQPSNSFQEHRKKATKITLAAADPEVPDDGTTTTLTGTVTRFGSPVAGAPVVLSTNPGGRVGDGISATTNGAGQVTFTVSDTQAESVTYEAGSTAAISRSNDVSVSYVTPGIVFKQAKAADFLAGLPIGRSLTLESPVKIGELIYVVVYVQGAARTFLGPTDSLGNVYTRIGPDSSPLANLTVWGTISASAGPVTVTQTIWDPGVSSQMAVLSYRNVKPASFLDATNRGGGTVNSTLRTTNAVALNFAGELLIGAFVQSGGDIYTPDPGFNLRVDLGAGVTGSTIKVIDQIGPTGASLPVTAQGVRNFFVIYASIGASIRKV